VVRAVGAAGLVVRDHAPTADVVEVVEEAGVLAVAVATTAVATQIHHR
jgi:hypothetical protein